MAPTRDELHTAAHAVIEAIQEVKAAFGAPGDYGYEKAEGKALFALYKARAALQIAIKATATPEPR